MQRIALYLTLSTIIDTIEIHLMRCAVYQEKHEWRKNQKSCLLMWVADALLTPSKYRS